MSLRLRLRLRLFLPTARLLGAQPCAQALWRLALTAAELRASVAGSRLPRQGPRSEHYAGASVARPSR
eukprot:15433501-Alexandrium_andersonii.AAC.1